MNDAHLFWDHLVGSIALSRINLIEYRYNPRELIYQQEKIKLYHYHPKANNPFAIPILIVFATVNRPEILDLFPEDSFIGKLLEQGLDVYLVDWGYPDKADKHLSMVHYVAYLKRCIDFIREQSVIKKINLIGICQGGLICLCYAALYQQLEKLVLISTPINFHTSDNLIANLINRMNLVDVALQENVPGDWLRQFFISLRPFDLLGKKFLHFSEQVTNALDTEKFLYVEKWLRDVPDQPAALFLELLKDFYQENKLLQGRIYLDEKNVELKNITVPILNMMGTKDEIIPMSASIALKKYVGSKEYTAAKFAAGHIGLYISGKVKNKLTKKISNWIKKHDKK